MTSPATVGQQRIALAAVAGAHGIKGEVRLKLFTDSAASLARHPLLTVGGKPLTLTAVRDAGKTAIARFAGIATREAAEALGGSLVEVERDSLPPLGDGEFYHADLIGFSCVDGGGGALGTVAGIENFGAGDLIEVERPDGRRALIPFKPGIADLGDGKITLDPDFLA